MIVASDAHRFDFGCGNPSLGQVMVHRTSRGSEIVCVGIFDLKLVSVSVVYVIQGVFI